MASVLTLTLSPVDRPLRLLKASGPSAVSVELTNLAPEGGGSNSILLAFIQMIDGMLASGRDFDLAHGYLALFLKVRPRPPWVHSIEPSLTLPPLLTASPTGAVPGPRCHGDPGPPLVPLGRRVGGATGIIRPISVSAVVRQERFALIFDALLY